MRVSSGSSHIHLPAERQANVQKAEAKSDEKKHAFQNTLTEDEKKKVQELKKRDTEVRAHERAHAAAGGHMAGSPNYQFATGPDGQRYAVGGDVAIQMPSAKDPAVRAQEARQVRAAATAPSQPSGQDLKVAAQASKVEMEAMAEMREQDGVKLKVCENCGSVHGLEKIQVEMAGKESTGQS